MSKTKEKEDYSNLTPLMTQYMGLKAKYPDAILLYRVGDFYETFGQDAVNTSRALGITLTARNNGGSDIELAGFPYHSMDMYLPRLVRAGYRVAICEQMEKPTPGKKIVQRSVTEVVTPGVATDDSLLDHNKNNFFACLAFGKNERMGIAFLDISTGEFFVCEGDMMTADKLLQSFKPSEVIVPKSRMKEFEAGFGDKFYAYSLEDWIFSYDFGREKLLNHFKTESLKGFGIEELDLAQCAAGAALQYLNATENKNVAHILSLSRLQTEKYVWLDRFTIRNLELLQSNHETGKALIDVLDKTVSPMGARLLRKWVILPLTNTTGIQERLDNVEWLVHHEDELNPLKAQIRSMGDLERLMGKVVLGKVNPREIVQIRRALLAIEQLKAMLQNSQHTGLRKIAEGLNLCITLRERIEQDIQPDPPVNLAKGGVIADGADAALDDLRHVITNAKTLLLDIQTREVERTGISSLKIGFNSVFGYYLEVTNKYKDQVPPEWMRKQTLTGGERYITEELKKLEEKILGAEEKILAIEEEIFAKLIAETATYIKPLQDNSHLIARLDCLISFATVALKSNYCKPIIDQSLMIDIKEGRHPVIETQLKPGDTFVPNDVLLDNDLCQIMMITGPNMSGKSALLRQTALIALLSQMGSYVPAKSARIGLIDKVFTRVGASDNISSGESTFMVEMNETALIMNNVSERSLILLDEIGRGTSTYDGISIAWSIAEYLHNNPKAQPKTLFATHYHELNELAQRHERIHNYHVSTRQVGQKVVFLRKLELGGSNHSFGIHVARMAGMPQEVIERANEILKHLETQHIHEETQEGVEKPKTTSTKKKMESAPANIQLSIFESLDPYTIQIKQELLALDINSLTPIDALWKINELRKIAAK